MDLTPTDSQTESTISIILLASSYPSGPLDSRGIFYQDQARALARCGVRVTVISPIMHPINKRIALSKLARTTVTQEGDFLRVIRKSFYGPFPRMPQANALIWCYVATKLRKLYVSDLKSINLVHAHCTFNAGITALYWKSALAIPYILTEHSSAFPRKLLSKRQLHKANEVFTGASSLIAVSPFLAEHLNKSTKSINKVEQKWKYIPNLLGSRITSFNPLENVQPNKFRFINIGSAIPIKGQALLIEAFADSFPNSSIHTMTIVGSGPHLKRLKDIAAEKKILDQINFLGNLPPDEIARTLKSADVYVCSSLCETFGVALIEALSLGLPVVSTRCGGPENIINEKNGILVDKNSKSELSEALVTIFQNFKHFDRKSISEETRNKFGEKTVTNNIISTYRNTMCSKDE